MNLLHYELRSVELGGVMRNYITPPVHNALSKKSKTNLLNNIEFLHMWSCGIKNEYFIKK